MSHVSDQRTHSHQSSLVLGAYPQPHLDIPQSKSILFIDGRVQDAHTLATQVLSGTEVVILTPNRDGIEQITEVLASRQDLDNIHIFAHGAEGLLQLGSTQLTAENIDEYASQLAAWGVALSPEGDILLYGCNVAAGLRGEQFVSSLSQYTQADIAASTDISGSMEVGGDWDFEKIIGAIASSSPFQPYVLENYHSALSVTVPNLLYGVTNANPGVLYTLNVDTGAANLVPGGTLAVQTFTLARSPVNGFVYYTGTSGANASRLYYWNPVTGNNVLVTTGTPSPTTGTLFKLTFSNNGTLYLGDSTANLYVYNTTTGLLTRTITVTNNPSNTVQFTGGSGDIAFDPNDPNALYMTSFQKLVPSDPDTARRSLLYRIEIPINGSVTTATATYIGNTGIDTGGSLGFGPNNGLYASRGTNIVGDPTTGLFSLSTSNAAPTTISTTPSLADFASLPSPIILLDGSKVDGISSATAGSSVVYTITVRNTGVAPINAPLEGVRVVDTVPANLTVNSWTAGQTGGATGFTANGTGAVNDTNLTLPPGSSVVYTVNATINSSTPSGSQVINTVSISIPAFPATITASDTTTVRLPSANLSIEKSDGITTIAPGSNIIYTLIARNSGPDPVNDATIRDTIPAPLTVVGWGATGSTGTSGIDAPVGATNILNDTGVSIPVNGSVTYIVTTTVPNGTANGTTFSNSATIASSVPDPTPSNNTITDTNTVAATADLSITKTDGITTVSPGGTIIYTLVATNNGQNPVSDATIRDTIPNPLTVVNWGATGSAGTSGIDAPVGATNILNDTGVSIPVNGSVTYIVTTTVPNGTANNTAIANSATITSSLTDPTPSNNTITDTNTVVIPNADLGITKTDGITSISAGASLSYTIVARNDGPSAVSNATITDTFPSQLTNINWTATGSAGTSGFSPNGTGNINNTGVSLPSGGRITYVVTATVANGTPNDTTIVNTVNIASAVNDLNPGNNQATDDNTVVNPTTSADLSITKTDGLSTISPGGNLIYTLIARNLGPSAVTNATVTDTFPASLTNINWSATGANASGFEPTGSGNINDTGISLAATNGVITYVVTATVPNGTANGTTIANSAAIASPVNDPTIGNNTSTDTTTVTNPTANQPPVAVGDTTLTPLNTAVNIPVLGNDSDPDGGTLAITGFPSTVPNGTISRNGGQLVFTPANNFTGTVTFPYTISDGQGGAATAVVTVTVNPTANQDPVAVGDTTITPVNTAVSVPVLNNDSDPDGGTLAITGFPSTIPNGTISQNGGQLVFTPANNFTGNVTFPYTISDGQGGTATAFVTITVNPSANRPPVAVGDISTTPRGIPDTINVLPNDSDPDSDPITITSVGTPVNGTTRIDNGGTPNDPTDDRIIYTPNPGFVGTETFPYVISDGRGGTATAVVTVTVDNAPPVAVGDVSSTPVNTPVNIPVLGNDSDPDGGTLAITGFPSTVPNGTISQVGGQLVFIPANNFTGNVTFPYTITDGQGGTATAFVTVTVTNSPPVAVGDLSSTSVNRPVSIPVLGNDRDPDGDPLSITGVGTPNSGTVRIDDGGTPNDPSDDRVVYTPNPGFVGTDTFPYTISDGRGGVSTAVVTVTVSNNPPVAVGDIDSTPRDTPVNVPVLSNDRDPDGDPLRITGLGTPSNGRVEIDDGGTPNDPSDDEIRYIPNPGFVGTDVFPYTISDGRGGTSIAFVTISILNTVPNPNAQGDQANTPRNTPSTIPVLLNDTDPDGDPLRITTFTPTTPNGGTIAINNNGTPDDPTDDRLVYLPHPTFVGTDTFIYTITDGRGNFSTAGVTVTVSNDPPIAVGDIADTPLGRPVTVGVLLNDRDPNGDPLSISGFPLTTPNGGSLIRNDGGTPNDPSDDRIVYQPNPTFTGTDTFIYTISDGQGGSATAAVTVNVTTTPPIAVGDIERTPIDRPRVINILGNDRNLNGDRTLLLAGFSPTSENGGTILLNDNNTPDDPSDDTVTYTPRSGFSGVDTFSYTVSDGRGGTASATVTVNVAPTPITAVNDVFNVSPAGVTSIDPLGNDKFPVGQRPTLAGFSPRSVRGGTLNLNDGGTPNDPSDDRLDYIPAPGFAGTDRFVYTIRDAQGNLSAATVTVNVPGPNSPPIAPNETVNAPGPNPITFPVLERADDPNGDSLSISDFARQSTRGGRIARSDNGTPNDPSDDRLVYTPPINFTGTDTFLYTVSDGRGGLTVATITVNVVNGTTVEPTAPLPPPPLPVPPTNPPQPGQPTPPQPPTPTPGTFICDSQSAPSISRENFTDVRTTFAGSANADLIFGSSAVNDVIFGNLGNDFVYGYQAEDTLIGGKGADTLVGGKYRDSLQGHRGDDSLVGNQDADTMLGDRGHDILFGGKEDDWLYGGKGNDTVSGDRNNDVIYGHRGDDSLLGNQDSDTLFGDRGNDILYGGKDNDLLYAGKGQDTARGGVNEDVIYGHIGDDSLMGDHCPDTLYGDTGNDTLYGGKQEDVLHGGKQNDFLSGNKGQDTLLGEIAFDVLHGGKGDDWLNGGSEDDTVYGDQDNDVVYGGKGNDFLNGNHGRDTVLGDLGNDLLRGGKDNDLLNGGAGDDTILGDRGSDVYIGGLGRDLFVLSPLSATPDLGLADVVTDFNPGEDSIGLAGGLIAANLNFDFVGGNTIIRLANTNQILGIVNGINPGQLNGSLISVSIPDA